MIGFKIIDSSVWIAYIAKNFYSEIIDSDETFYLSALSLFEINKKLIKDKIPLREIEGSMKFIKEKSIIMPVTTEIAEKAVKLSFDNGLAAMDSLIYSTAIVNNLNFITIDNDFRGLAKVQFPIV